jgi:hypothetical protein
MNSWRAYCAFGPRCRAINRFGSPRDETDIETTFEPGPLRRLLAVRLLFQKRLIASYCSGTNEDDIDVGNSEQAITSRTEYQ